jgi:hypothetical protein
MDTATTTVRVRKQTHARINRLAAAANISTPDLIERLVEREENDQLLREMNDGFARLRADASAWAEFRAETSAWDAASVADAEA